MSDRIERLRLTDAAMWEMVKEPAEKQLAFTCAAIARNAQLELVLSAEVTCPRCEGERDRAARDERGQDGALAGVQ